LESSSERTDINIKHVKFVPAERAVIPILVLRRRLTVLPTHGFAKRSETTTLSLRERWLSHHRTIGMRLLHHFPSCTHQINEVITILIKINSVRPDIIAKQKEFLLKRHGFKTRFAFCSTIVSIHETTM
jgi:hypothetical protein